VSVDQLRTAWIDAYDRFLAAAAGRETLTTEWTALWRASEEAFRAYEAACQRREAV
jgi:hypothetical protein